MILLGVKLFLWADELLSMEVEHFNDCNTGKEKHITLWSVSKYLARVTYYPCANQ